MTIRNKKISQVRFDATNLNPPTVNRALDNIISTVNPFIDEVAAQLNTLETTTAAAGQITINPENAASVTNSTFNLYGANGITFGSNGINSITISQTTSSASGSSNITLNAQTGSISGSTFNIIAEGCCIHTETSGSNTLIISSSAPCNFSGSTNIEIITPSTTYISGTNLNTMLLAHFDAPTSTPPYFQDFGKAGADNSTFDSAHWVSNNNSPSFDNTIWKFGTGSIYLNGTPNTSMRWLGYGSPNAYVDNANGTSGDFTFEMWVYPVVTAGTNYTIAHVFDGSPGGNNSTGPVLGQQNGFVWFAQGGLPATATTGALQAAVWQALAVCRSGNVTRVYLDGTAVGVFTGLDYGTNKNSVVLGQYAANTYVPGTFPGNIDEFRFSNVALYTGSTYQTASVEFSQYSGTTVNVFDDCSRQFFLTGAVPQPAIYSGSYPSPQFLAPTISGGVDYPNDHVLPIKNVDNLPIWLSPQYAEVGGALKQATIGIRGQDAIGATFQSLGGGDAKVVGGRGTRSAIGGDAYLLGGKGGSGNAGQTGGDGGNAYIRGGIQGDAGAGANTGNSGSIFIGDTATYHIDIGNSEKDINGNYKVTTTVRGNFIAPILGDVSGNANVTKVVGLQGNPVKSGSIAYGSPLIYGTEGWYGQLISGSDPNTISLLHFDGTNGSTTFPDTGFYSGSAQQINWQQFGGGDISTAQYRFGGASLYLQAVNSEYVSSSQTSLLNFIGCGATANLPNGDYTIELWFYLNSYGGLNGNTLFHLRNPNLGYPNNLEGIHAWVGNSGQLVIDNGVSGFFNYPSLVTTGAWHNLVIVRQGTAYRFYYDGTAVGGGTNNGIYTGAQTISTIQIGRYGNGGTITDWDGYIDEFRVSNVARYPAGNLPATMTTQSAEFPNAYPQVITQYGDISGSFAGFTVTGIQGYPVTGGAPTQGDILIFDSGVNTTWIHRNTRVYGSFYDTTTQTASATPNTALPIKINSTVSSWGCSLQSGSQIRFDYNGTYNIQFSAQFDKTDAGTDDVDVWLERTGSNVPWSNGQLSLVGNNAKMLAAWNYVDSFTAGEYVQLMWYSADANLRILAQGTQSSPARPEIPSVIVTVSQV